MLGTSVSWVGFIPNELPHNASSATYSVDGGPPIFFPLKGLSPGPSNTFYNQFFFTTPELTPGAHSLVVVHQGTAQQTPLTLDFLYVTNTSTPVTPSPTPSTNSTTTIPSPTPQPHNHGPPIGAIVGGVVGGLALIALTLFFLWWYKREQRRARTHFSPRDASDVPPHLEVSPFMYDPSLSRSGVPEMSYGTSTNPSSLQNDMSPQRGLPVVTSYHPPSPPANDSHSTFSNPRHGHAPSASTSSGALSGYNLNTMTETRAMRKQGEGVTQPVRHPVVHEDSGLRIGRETMIEDVPPTYTVS
jgi:hypothetical protein